MRYKCDILKCFEGLKFGNFLSRPINVCSSNSKVTFREMLSAGILSTIPSTGISSKILKSCIPVKCNSDFTSTGEVFKQLYMSSIGKYLHICL